MREIKFRAFEIDWKNNGNKQGRMIQWEDIRDEFAIIQDRTSYFILMQFTGLKDKNGKEIYEGDLLQVAKNRIYEVVFTTKGEYDEIQCGFGLSSKDIPDFIIDTYAVNEGEVIGNIYDNPELVK